jgi:hypothetical protein
LDVISWSVGLIAGSILPLPRAAALAVGTSVLIRAYQYFVADSWGKEMPADLIGATAMILASCLFAYIGSILRTRRIRRTAG